MLTVPLQINGKDVFTSKTIDVTNPSTGQVIHKASSAGVTETIQAVEAAEAAFPAWAELPFDQKRNIFLKAADILERRTEEVGKWEEEEAGATTFYASGFDVPTAVSGLREVAGKISLLHGTVPCLSDPTRSAMVLKEPFGAILAIAPWNATFILGFRSVSFAIAAGNTVVLKASEIAPRSLGVVGTVFKEAGLPDGVLNIIQSHPEDAAAVTKTSIEHPAIKKINFTGSTAVGRIIAKTAGENLKPVLMELGGKAPAIVLDDADLSLAAQGCALGAFMHTGQICMSTERILVQESVSEKFAEELVSAIEMMFPSGGDALVNVSSAGVVKNKKLLKDAKEKGANMIFGDINAEEAAPERMRPVVVKGVKKSMDLYYAESFGPTVSFIEVENEQEAIKIANDTEYGLSSSIYTKDLARGLKIAKKIESGAVHINSMSVHDEPALPHGGVKSSGWGRFGAPGMEEWVKTKTITYKN
ncbi:aldehyde dehydrogenase [Mollisia scopiformis]|uniref:Aldehyde dehydrogenase n=1 Tax=Mollisia scopiformis TaxID=149040 RepID=A0A194WSI9_MOLSC|nr:aldehyde dehydrogenase [Mollisia scopiformis]KUJ10923.1 aldehyde dehydrogenase [Mollisia scopiformis]